jgi:HEAT repeat protein
MPQLLGATKHENPQVRYHTTYLLGHTHAPEAFEPLLRLMDDPDGRVRFDAIVYLGELGDPRAIEPLIQGLTADDPDIAGAPGQALSKLGPVALPQVQNLLAHDDPGIRQTAVNILGGWAVELGDAASLDALRPLAEDANADVRADVRFWLEEAKNRS